MPRPPSAALSRAHSRRSGREALTLTLPAPLQTVKEGGPRELYRGIVPNLLKAVPAISISYVVFECD